MVLFLIAFAASAFAAVDMRIVKVSESEAGGTVTLVVKVEIKGTFSWEIYDMQGEFYVGDALRDLTPTPTINDQLFFTNAKYTISSTYSNGHCYFDFYETAPGTGNSLTTATWHEVIRYTLVYAGDWVNHTTFAWTSAYKSFIVDAWNSVLVSPYPVTGAKLDVPSNLRDMSLPVQMNDFLAKYSYDKGVQLKWTTQSELNAAGFYVLRGESADGPFDMLNTAMIPAHGTTSSINHYSFTDRDVQWNKKYYYKLHEISTLFMDTTFSFYGPVAVQTGRVPANFSLSQNYPNPFNPETRITFETAEAGVVRVVVFNLLGKEIRTLVNDYRPAGIYEVRWDGKDELGNEAPSGIYMYRLFAGDKSDIRKMTKMK
jgi:hypothetical protein